MYVLSKQATKKKISKKSSSSGYNNNLGENPKT